MPDDLRQRKSPRLKDYDYSQEGAYFITICTHNRVTLFGQVVDQEMVLNEYGAVVENCWFDLPNHYDNIILDAFVVMPNHLHGIVVINSYANVREGLRPSPTPKQHCLTEIVRALKSFSSRQINQLRETPGTSIWQRSFHDHIIRNETSLNKIREYVLYNPALWEKDRFYTE